MAELTTDQLKTILNNIPADQQQLLLQALGVSAGSNDPGSTAPAPGSSAPPTPGAQGLPLDVMSMASGLAAIRSKAETDQLARQYLGQQIQRENILNNHGANTSYLSALGTAQALGPDILKAAMDNIAPYPGKSVVIVNAPVTTPAAPAPAPQPMAPATDQPQADPTATSPVAAVATTAAKALIPNWAKALIAAGSLAATGVGGYALAPKTPTVNVTTPTVEAPVVPQQPAPPVDKSVDTIDVF